MIDSLKNPSLLDLLVLEKVIPRSELGSTARGKQVVSAVRTLDDRITAASIALEAFGVTEDEIRELTNRKICERIDVLGV